MAPRSNFMRSLTPIDPKDGPTRAVQHLLRVKGASKVARPLGMFTQASDGEWTYYYRLPEGILEVQVFTDGDGFKRRVSDFITDSATIDEMLDDTPDA